MSGVLGLLQLMLLTELLGAVAVALGIGLLYPRLRAALTAMTPARRATVLTATALSPLWLPALLLGLTLLPSLGSGLLSFADHCHAHHDDHPHLCPLHLPAGAGSLAGWAWVAAALTLASGRIGLFWSRRRPGLRALRQLQGALGQRRGPLRWFDDPRPLAFTMGWLQPRTLLSRALRGPLSPAGLRVLLAHERAHRRRRDPLRLALVETGAALLPPRAAALLIEDCRLACEQACDEAAARQCGDRAVVAQTLLAVERALGACPASAVAFGDSSATARVQSLLAEPARPAPRRYVLAGLLSVATLLLASADSIHHGLETLLENLIP